MKRVWQLSLKEVIASYMVGLKKTKATKEDIHDFAEFIEKTLTTEADGFELAEEYRAVPSSCDYTDLAREDNGYLFNISEDNVSLASGKTEDDLCENVLAYCHSDYLYVLEDLAEEYLNQKKTKNEEENEQEK